MKRLLFISLTVLLTGCVSPKVALNYDAQSTLEFDAAVTVTPFNYQRASTVRPNQIPNTAIGEGLFTPEPIAVFFSDAVRKELRQSGISLSGNCELTGSITRLLVDDFGFSVDYLISVDYRLGDGKGNALLSQAVNTELTNMSKFVAAQALMNNLNKMFSDNIMRFISTQAFNDIVEERCAPGKQ